MHMQCVGASKVHEGGDRINLVAVKRILMKKKLDFSFFRLQFPGTNY